jgi:hypothetical protein
MATPEAGHQKIQVIHEWTDTDYNLNFIDPATGKQLAMIGLPREQMIKLVMTVVNNLQGQS